MFTRFKNVEGAAALLAAAFIYATFGILIREISKMFSAGAQTAARFGLAALIAGTMLVFARKAVKLTKKEWLLILALSLTFSTVVFLYTIAVTHTTIANSVFLLYAGSIFTSFLIGTFVFKERVTAVRLLAIAIGLVGLLMYSHALLTFSVGVVAALASGLFDGIANGLRKKLKNVDRNVVVSSSYAIGALVGLCFALFAGGAWVYEVSLSSVLVLVVFSVLLVFISNLLLFGFQHFDVNVGTVILASELFFATVLGLLFFGERPSTNEIFGGVLIFIASIIASVDFKALRRHKKAKTV